VSTLKELVLKRPQGPESTESFLQALLEVTMGHIELVGMNTFNTDNYCSILSSLFQIG
jgi:hypothetical protein